MRLKRLNPSADLSCAALEECLRLGLPSDGEAVLHVHRSERSYAQEAIAWASSHSAHKFPRTTVLVDDHLRRHEWFIVSGEVAIGSGVAG